jgi:hypothetical protein
MRSPPHLLIQGPSSSTNLGRLHSTFPHYFYPRLLSWLSQAAGFGEIAKALNRHEEDTSP